MKMKRLSFQKILREFKFVYTTRQSSAILEREDIVTWRRRYLDQIRQYRAENRPIYYLDEICVYVQETHGKSLVDSTVNSPRDAFPRRPKSTTAPKKPSGRGRRLIVIHIGSTDGFVPGGLLFIESKTKSLDYHREIHGDTFFEWFKKMLPLLKENAVIVMDNVSYHSVKKDPIPVMSWKKSDIIGWLENKGEIVTQPTIKALLLERVGQLKTQYDKYIIDEYAKDNNKTVLRLPPYHFELNPMELGWSSEKSYVRTHNKTYKIKDVHELLKKGVEHVTPDMWKNFVGQVKNEEETFWNIDFITDEIMDEGAGHVLTIETGDISSSELNYD